MLNWLRRLFFASINNPGQPINSDTVREILMGGTSSESGVSVNQQTALGLTAVWRAVNLISGDLAKVPLEILDRRTRGQRVEDHSLWPVIRQAPNQFMTAFTFKRLLQTHALLHGNGYAAIKRADSGRVVELLPLKPSPHTYPVIDDEGRLWYVTSDSSGHQARIPGEDVIHIKGLSDDGFEGLSVIKVLANALGVEIAQQKFVSKFYTQGASGVGFLRIPANITEDEITRLRRQWQDMVQGIDKVGHVFVLSGGMEFQGLSLSPEDSQLIQSREFGLREIANIFGLPPHKVGDSTRVSYNSLEQENFDYLETTLDAWFVAWEQELENKLLLPSERDRYSIRFRRQALVRVDFGTRINGLAKLREIGVLTANDIARIEDLGDLGPRGDRLYVPSNWSPVGDDGLPINPESLNLDSNALASLEDIATQLIGPVLRAESEFGKCDRQATGLMYQRLSRVVCTALGAPDMADRLAGDMMARHLEAVSGERPATGRQMASHMIATAARYAVAKSENRHETNS